MIKTITLLATGSLLSTAAVAQDLGHHRKMIDRLAHTETSAQTCSQTGYSVDFDGIVGWKSQLRDAAISDGMDPSEFDARMAEKVQLKYQNIQERYANADRMVEDSENRRRYKRYWNRRCKKLSEAEDTSSFFQRLEE